MSSTSIPASQRGPIRPLSFLFFPLFWLHTGVLSLVTILIVLPAYVWPESLGGGRHFLRYGNLVSGVQGWLMSRLLRGLCGLRISWPAEVSKLRKKGPFMVVSNHQSFWETFGIPEKFFPNTPVAKASIRFIPLLGWSLWMSGVISINREEKRRALSLALEQARLFAKDGRHIIIFPQGTRRPFSAQMPFQRGYAVMAKAAVVPILPLVHDSGSFFGGFLIPSGTLRVTCGAPIETSGLSVEAIHERCLSSLKALHDERGVPMRFPLSLPSEAP